MAPGFNFPLLGSGDFSAYSERHYIHNEDYILLYPILCRVRPCFPDTASLCRSWSENESHRSCGGWEIERNHDEGFRRSGLRRGGEQHRIFFRHCSRNTEANALSGSASPSTGALSGSASPDGQKETSSWRQAIEVPIGGRNTDGATDDIANFLASYRETLQASLPDEQMPEELLVDYVVDSCLRKDPEGRKELYVLRRKKDDKKALLRITKDYPEEDALEEAKLLSGLDHPGIPKVYASYEKDGKRYLIREYLEGRSLFEVVKTGGSLSAKDIFSITLKLTDILHYLHTQTPPVIHRDIKPQNIITGPDGSIHLIDFGIARVHKEERRQDTAVILTLDYASPEQYGFEQTTPLSDIYSLGVVLLFLATGRTARSGLVAQIVNNKLRNLIEQCIAFNPKARIQSVKRSATMSSMTVGGEH